MGCIQPDKLKTHIHLYTFMSGRKDRTRLGAYKRLMLPIYVDVTCTYTRTFFIGHYPSVYTYRSHTKLCAQTLRYTRHYLARVPTTRPDVDMTHENLS